MAGDGGGDRRPAARQLLEHHDRAGGVEPEAADARLDGRAQQAELGQLADDRFRIATGRLVIGDRRNQRLLDELPHGQDDLPPLVRLALAGGERAEPFAVTLDELAGDERALDHVGALADEHQRRVTVVALDLEPGEHSGLAVGAQRDHRRLVGRLRGEQLGHARLEIAALLTVLHAGRPVGDDPRRLDAGGEIGQDRGRLAGDARVRQHAVERRLGDADAAGGDVDAPGLEPAHDLSEPASLDAAHEIGGRHQAVLEQQLHRVDALVAELGERFHDAESGMGLLDEEARHAAVTRLRARVGDGQQRERGALAAVGDEHLAAVDDVVVAGASRRRADRLHVGAGVRLGQAQPAAGLAAREGRQEAPALLVGAVVQDDERRHRVAVEDPGQRHPAPAQLLDDPRVGRDVEPEAAVLGRHQGAEEPERPQAGDEAVRIGVGVLQRGGDRPHLLVHEAPHGGHDRGGHREGIVQ